MWTCDSPLSFLGDLPVEMVVTRAVVVITCTVCILAIPGLICGMRCTKLISDIQNQKVKLILSSGILFLFGGVSGAVGLLWYGADTLIKYRQEVKFGIPGVTYELGFSYWLAAGAVACIVTSAVTLLTQHCMAQRKADFRSGPTVLPLSHWSHLKYPGHRTENGQTYI
ncbi:claudin-16-like [Lepisosteus oculatus]|uniref:claudin-16-like n=1 Tax=Lepisosteus oculatus TaxID=7918 RepID=UPI0037205303